MAEVVIKEMKNKLKTSGCFLNVGLAVKRKLPL
jgi:hypothetical protein